MVKTKSGGAVISRQEVAAFFHPSVEHSTFEIALLQMECINVHFLCKFGNIKMFGEKKEKKTTV